jgi:hypothetical protein
MGIDCILIADGHNSKQRLLRCNIAVLGDLSALRQEIIEDREKLRHKRRFDCQESWPVVFLPDSQLFVVRGKALNMNGPADCGGLVQLRALALFAGLAWVPVLVPVC